MKAEYKSTCFTITCLLMNLFLMQGQSTSMTPTQDSKYYVLIDTSDSNFDIQYNDIGHPVKITMKVTRGDMDSFKVVYDPLNSSNLFPNGHSHFYIKKDEGIKPIDYGWFLKSNEVTGIVHNPNQFKIYFICNDLKEKRFWSVYETGIVIEIE
ncbi:hypothetical protein V1387_07400 [Allomuricauda taeanensis]|uniref:hypothetical protein n=1 Tax=Flagellimonas taeanensis TaxID=1005926 RepID=UPI002E7C1494|nr:hypothetical protein [Allomuricauda taeanensis]MEE1962506.1 hypothetical protein [Allomuricauda taeanensis]